MKKQASQFYKKTHEENIVIKYTDLSIVVSLKVGLQVMYSLVYASNSIVSHNLEWKEIR